MLVTAIYKILKVIVKSHQDHKVRTAGNYEPKWRFKAKFLFPAIRARLWFDSRLRHNAFRKPGLRTLRLPYHFIVASKWDWNQAFTRPAECNIAHAFRAAIKLTQCCYQGCVEGAWTRRQPRTSKAVGHPKSGITKKAFIKILYLDHRCKIFCEW